MNRATTLAVILSAGFGALQPAFASAPEQPGSPAQETVKLHNRDQGLIAAALLPLRFQDPIDGDCEGKKESGDVGFSFILDAAGRARNIVFDRALGNALDYLAEHIVESEKFQPATLNGTPVAVGSAMKMHLTFCFETVKDKSGTNANEYRLRALPEQKLEPPPQTQKVAILTPIPDPQATPAPPEKVGNGITPPHLLNQPEAEFSGFAGWNHSQGRGKFSLTVDEHGLPRDIKVVTPLDQSLLENAYDAVSQFRFKPATKNGVPVRVQIEIEMDFKKN